MTAAEREYGAALYELAREEACEDEILAGLELARRELDAQPEYRNLLQNPALEKEKRLGLLDEAFGGGVHRYVCNFLKLLCERSALGMLPGCVGEYRARLYEDRGILPVTAVSAVALTGAQEAALKRNLAEKTGKQILLESRVDPSLLGGMKVLYAGKELDGSVAGRLAALRKVLTES